MIIIISYYILKKMAIFCKFIGLFKKLIKKVRSIQSKVLTEKLNILKFIQTTFKQNTIV